MVQGQDKGQGGLRVIVTFTDYSNSDTVCANTVEEILKCEHEMVDVNVWPRYCLGGKRRLKKSCVLPKRFCLSRFPGFSQPRCPKHFLHRQLPPPRCPRLFLPRY